MSHRNHPGKTQSFSITAPGASNVLLAGDFTHWQDRAIPLTPESSGVWKTQINLNSGTYRYRFIVDGEWRDDPDCIVRVPNPFGTHDAVRKIA